MSEAADRKLIDGVWTIHIESAVEEAAVEAQANDWAERAAADIARSFTAEQFVGLDAGEEQLLLRTGGVPRDWFGELELVLYERLRGDAALVNLRDQAIRKRVKERVRHDESAIRRLLDQLFERRRTDRLCDADDVKPRVLRRLTNSIVDAAMAGTLPEAELRRRLKLIAVMTSVPTGRVRQATLRGLTNGRTAAFPYVPRYLDRDRLPSFERFTEPHSVSFGGFTPEALAAFPEAKDVEAALGRYVARAGVLDRFMPIDRTISAQLTDQFRSVPEMLVMPGHLLAVPKTTALQHNRSVRQRMPEAVAVASGLMIMLEWMLRQATHHVDGDVWARTWELIPKLPMLASETKDLLSIVFPRHAMGLRDSYSHGVFVAGDDAQAELQIAGLSVTVGHVVQDLSAAGVLSATGGWRRWDSAAGIDAAHDQAIQKQFSPGLNVFDTHEAVANQKVLFSALAELTPDKRLLGETAFLLTVNALGRKPVAPEETRLITLVVGFIVLEEFYRAVVEDLGGQTLIIAEKGADRVKAELNILDEHQGRLLDHAVVTRVFGANRQGLDESLRALRAYRDKLFHGCVGASSRPWTEIAHLIQKVFLALADSWESNRVGSRGASTS